MRTLDDGTKVINTTMLSKDITGYGGAVPLEIYVKDNKIVKVKALKNAETPEFFAETKPLLAKWNGKTIDEALRLKVDAVSGATFSSRGIIGNMRRGLAYASQKAVEPSILEQMDLNAKTVSALLVVLLGAIVPLFYRNKHYRTVQLLLNVVVLGFARTCSYVSHCLCLSAFWQEELLLHEHLSVRLAPRPGCENEKQEVAHGRTDG